jgi:hypothetical protein
VAARHRSGFGGVGEGLGRLGRDLLVAPGELPGTKVIDDGAEPVGFGLAALGLCLLYGLVFTIVFIVIGLFASNAQAAQSMSMIAFVLAFVSSTYVPPESMPGWLQPFAK